MFAHQSIQLLTHFKNATHVHAVALCGSRTAVSRPEHARTTMQHRCTQLRRVAAGQLLADQSMHAQESNTRARSYVVWQQDSC